MMLCSARSRLFFGPRLFIRWLRTQGDASEKNTPKHLVGGKSYAVDEFTNVPPSILRLLKKKAHLHPTHPVNLIKQQITAHFIEKYRNSDGSQTFSVNERLSPVVTLKQNFDSLLVPADHPSRSKTDFYHLNEEFMLRSHILSHQKELIGSGQDAFLVIGDVYRREEVDRLHYPYFHQVGGVRLFTQDELSSTTSMELGVGKEQSGHLHESLENDLKSVLEGVVTQIFERRFEFRWVDALSPFTHPSFALEMRSKNDWIKVLSCGIMRPEISSGAESNDRIGWAFGIGLERFAMLYHGIDDIREFWSDHPNFHEQFDFVNPYKRINFQPISKDPPRVADLSFWIPDQFETKDFYEIARTVGMNFVQEVVQTSVYRHPEALRTAHTYRITYRHISRALKRAEFSENHQYLAAATASKLGVELKMTQGPKKQLRDQN